MSEVKLTSAFVGLSPARQLAIDAQEKADRQRAAGLPIGSFTEQTAEIDPVSGMTIQGTKEIVIRFDGTMAVGGFTPSAELDPSQRLEVTQNRLIADVLARRDREILAGVDTEYGVMAADPDTQRLITGAATLAFFAQDDPSFSKVITLKDRTSTPPLNAQQMIAFARTVGEFVDGHFAAARAIEDELRDATTLSEVIAIGVREGLMDPPRDADGQFISYDDAAEEPVNGG